MISVINFGFGNIGSILNMLKYLEIPAEICDNPNSLEKANKIILAGVGAFDSTMNEIKSKGFFNILNKKVIQDNIPILGICLGMQLFTNSSEEGEAEGFGWIPGTTKMFPNKSEFKIPHVGWNYAKLSNNNKLISETETKNRYYFSHSYYVHVHDQRHSVMKTNYILDFDSVISFENIYGVQFHPEKSHRFGMKIMKNFEDI